MNISDAFEIGRLDAQGQASLLRRGALTPLEAVEAAILRVEALDPAIAAISTPAFELARSRAAGPLPDRPLAGVPWLLKDSLDYRGLPSRAGSRSRSEAPAKASYPFARVWDAEGLIPLGKTTMPEFGLLPTSEPTMGPHCRNPWSLSRSPGGSSGGAAAAVASGMTPLAHGSDGAGSIRIPASCCGVVGLKPGRGAVVRVRGHSIIEDLIVGDVLMARTVRDVAWAFAAAHPDQPAMTASPSGRRFRIGLCTRTLDGALPDPATAAAATQAAALCESLGHSVAEATPMVDWPAVLAAIWTLWELDAADAVNASLADGAEADAFEAWTLTLAEAAGRQSPLSLERAFFAMTGLVRAMEHFHQQWDVLLTPTVPALPPPVGLIRGDRPDARAGMQRYIGYTALQNLAGGPAVSLPLAWCGDLPVGVMFAAARGGEATLLELAYELEAALPWGDRWPPLVRELIAG